MRISWIQPELDLAGFDRSELEPTVESVRQTGLDLTTLAALGDDEVNRHRLYELNAVCSADIPDRGPFHTWDDYRRLRLEVQSFDPAGVILAVDRGSWVGMATTSAHSDRGFAFNEMTGVVRSHRRRGIALALKLLGIDYAMALGVPVVRTVHHPDNSGMIKLNRRLGYVDTTW